MRGGYGVLHQEDGDSVRFDEADRVAFRADHPGAQGTARDRLHRLTAALAAESGAGRRPRRVRPWV